MRGSDSTRWRGRITLEILRRVGVAVLAGAVAGLVAGGVGGRLFMSVLAALNPTAAGVKSDDGFTIGEVTLGGTLNLLMVATVIGAAGGPVWVAVRGLRFGPGWWRAASMPLAVTLVVGGQVIHSDGVDFTLLDPPALAVGFTLAVPVLATVLVTALGDRWIADDRTVWQEMPAALAWTARGAITIGVGAATLGLIADLRLIL